MTFLITAGISLLYILTSLLLNANLSEIISILSLKIPILFTACGLSIFSIWEIKSQEGEIEVEKERTKYLLKAFHTNVVAIQKKNKMLSELYNISLKPQIHLSFPEQLTHICEKASQFLNTDIAGIWIIEKDKETLKLTSSGKNIAWPFKEKIRIKEGIVGRIAFEKRAINHK